VYGKLVCDSMEVKNRRRQESPFRCLKPLIRVWGIASAIGKFHKLFYVCAKFLIVITICCAAAGFKFHLNKLTGG
jgi:hypothetical protein